MTIWEKYTHAQLKELANKYNHIVGIKNFNKISRRELEHELSKHLEVHTDSQGKHSITIKSKTEIWRPRNDIGDEEAKRVYAEIKHEVMGEKLEKKEEEKKRKSGKTAKDSEHKGYTKPVKKTRKPKSEKAEMKVKKPRKPKSEKVEMGEKKPRGRPKKIK